MNGVPQGSVLDPPFLYLQINNLGVDAYGTYTHCYANDDVLHSYAPLLREVKLEAPFNFYGLSSLN